MSYHVYIIQSLKDQKYYVGSCSDVEARVRFHNSGLQRSTRHRIPFVLVHTEAYEDKHSALLREKQLKKFKGGDAFKKLIGK